VNLDDPGAAGKIASPGALDSETDDKHRIAVIWKQVPQMVKNPPACRHTGRRHDQRRLARAVSGHRVGHGAQLGQLTRIQGARPVGKDLGTQLG
jgi:hypothetical protein